MPCEYLFNVFRLVYDTVYHGESHRTWFRLRASEADVVGIDVIVFHGITLGLKLGPMSEPKHQPMARMSYVSSLALLIVTSHEPGEWTLSITRKPGQSRK